MKFRFVHVGFDFTTASPPIAALEATFKKARDWLRYDSHCWILYTSTDLDTWRDRIKNTTGIVNEDSFFLCEFTETSGYMNEWVWKWLAKDRSQK